MSRPYRVTYQAPGGVPFELNLADPLQRSFAWCLDLVVIMAMVNVTQVVINITALLSPDLGYALSILLYFILSLGYGIICESFSQGQTLGKRLFKLRVIDAEHGQLRFSQILMRNLLRFIDALPFCYFVGGVASAISQKAQRLGDIAAGTLVVDISKKSWTKPEKSLSNVYNSLWDDPIAVGRLRRKLGPVEASFLLKVINEGEHIQSQQRHKLYGIISKDISHYCDLPQEKIENIPNEQILRNITQVLWNQKN